MKQKHLKILIEMKHGLGDCVCMLPAIKAVREKYPNAYIAMIVNSKANEEIFRHGNVKIDRYHYFSLKNYSKISTLNTLAELFLTRFDIGILATMTPATKGKMLFKLLGIKECYGEQYDGRQFLDLDNSKHFVDRNLDVVHKLTGDVVDRQPHLFAFPSDGDNFTNIFSRLQGKNIAVNIGGADKNYYKGNYVFTRSWNKNSMHELTKSLSNIKKYNVFLIGGKLEEELLIDYEDVLVKNNVFNFVNQTTIGETIYILSQSDCVIGVDTGMQHVADALGKPTVSIFGPTNPSTHGAYSSQARFVQCRPLLSCQYCFTTNNYYTCPNRRCLNTITSENVLQVVEESLQRR